MGAVCCKEDAIDFDGESKLVKHKDVFMETTTGHMRVVSCLQCCCFLAFAVILMTLVELSHFHLLRSVGKGAFGKVRVVQHKKTKEIYALKYINKAKCIRMRAVENIIQERRLLEEVEFSLICNLRYAFQDDENLFMVLDLMLGGDLRFHLERAGPMKEDVVRFYVAELALALNALHSRRVIHRQVSFFA